MADSYEYEHVKNFLSYKSILESFGHDFSVDPTNDPIIAKCRNNVSVDVVKRFFFTDLCIKINKYLKHFNDLKQNIHEHCEYLNYYLNDKYNNNSDNFLYKNALDPKDPLNMFDASISNISEYKCKLYHIKEDVFKNIHILNKLNEEYILFITKKARNDVGHNDVCNNARNFANIFKTAIIKCYDNYDNNYCKELKAYRKKYNIYAEYINTCSDVPSLKLPPEPNTLEVSTNTRDLPTIENDSYSASDIGVLVGKIFGGCLASLLVYKFTPLKSLLPFRKQKKNTYLDNIDYEAYVYYSPSYEHEQAFEDTGQYNVQYYSRYDFEEKCNME
ncbi:PIR protein [Plasmodium ovale]|uniref:PIR protein n=1 Tax=Plasmodium ovale TaxID=36330 RepID=A0A1D3JE61_PLAOA|nr:PIR protein [Plasmodium ovale]